MPTFQVKIGKATYIVVADGIDQAMSLAQTEDEHREGVTVPISMVKQVEARVVGIRETDTQPKLWAAKEN